MCGGMRVCVCPATVQVTLWNTGEDAYLHEQYGDWVTIERVIKANSGGTQYKLINAAGKKVCAH